MRDQVSGCAASGFIDATRRSGRAVGVVGSAKTGAGFSGWTESVEACLLEYYLDLAGELL
jgi:hypothetical protein